MRLTGIPVLAVSGNEASDDGAGLYNNNGNISGGTSTFGTNGVNAIAMPAMAAPKSRRTWIVSSASPRIVRKGSA